MGKKKERKAMRRKEKERCKRNNVNKKIKENEDE